MAIGLTPKYEREFTPGDLTPEQFLTVAVEAAKKLGWTIGLLSKNSFIAHTKFSFASYGEEFRIIIQDGTAGLSSKCTGGQMVDWGKNEKNIQAFINAFTDLQQELTREEMDIRYTELKTDMVSCDESELVSLSLSGKEKIAGFFSLFVPREGYTITPLLIDLNIILFLLMVISGVNAFAPDTESLISWGANLRPLTTGGEWWRLLTNCFLHIGVFHLLMNMFALVYIGILLEPYLGKARFATAYLLTGIAASVCSLWWHDITISAGASGAIFGMYGVFLAMLTTNLIDKASRKSLLYSIGIFVIYNLANGMKGGIDNAAHIGGLVSGLVIGYGFYPSLKVKPEEDRQYDLAKISISIISFVVLFSCYLVYLQVPVDVEKKFLTQQDMKKYDIDKYNTKIREFISSESEALSVLSLPKETPKEQLLAEIKNRGIYYWKDNIELIYEVEKYNLPPFLHHRNKLLFDYCNLRIKSYELIYKMVENNTNLLQPQIEDLDKQIGKIVTELSANIKPE
jgi:rhomboid protease GluP